MLRCSFFRPCVAVLLFAASAFGQSQNAVLGGQVTDQTGSFVPNASVTIKASDRQFSATVKTDTDGRYSFPNLDPGNYDLTVEATGFKSYVSTKIQLLATESRRIDPQLQVGDASTRIEVQAEAAQLNVDSGAKSEGVAPTVINQLPLLVSAGTPRNAVQFITFLPGVNTGTSPQAFNARINGGLKMGDEAVMDGVSMQEGTMSQSGMVSFFDFASTPDMVDEVKVLTSSYLPEYGTTTGGELIVTSRHGSDQFHGGAFEYLRNKDLNALQFTNNRPAGDARPKDNENEPGFNIGGPVLIKYVPFIWGSKHKTYFFANLDWLRSLGGASREVLSIPSTQELSAGDHCAGSIQQLSGAAGLRRHSLQPKPLQLSYRLQLERQRPVLRLRVAAAQSAARTMPITLADLPVQPCGSGRCLGEPVQLGSHLQPDVVESHGLRLREPQ